MQPPLGIDLGTTNSLVAVFQDGRPRLLPNALGELLTPSAVGVLDSGEVLVGRAACELALTRPERVASGFKRWMGTERRVDLGGRSFGAPELSSLVLMALKQDAEAALGVPVRRAVVTVPAYFDQLQRAATQLAGRMAGLEVERIVNEPTAAALTYGLHERAADRTLVVFDLGGGTFDVTVMEVFAGTLEILATAGESRLGGDDFTSALAGHALRALGRNLETAELAAPLLVARALSEAESAKREVCARGAARMRLFDAEGNVAAASAIAVTAQELELLCAPLLARLRAPLERALRDAGRGWEAIDEVLLVGGATRMPAVRRLVAELAGRAPLDAVDPDRAVALGAAVQAALIADDRGVADLVMTDVCPFSLGVAVSKRFGSRRVDGYFTPVIHRNTTIPVSREEHFQTVEDGQTAISVEIYQGEGRRVEENLHLGNLEVSGIPPGPAGQAVALRFTYDLNGLLEVEALIEGTGARFQTVLRNLAGDMSERELQQAIRRIARLKFYPRDELANQHLLRYAERCVKEVAPLLRAGLDSAVDSFDAALHGGDRERFAAARERLLIALSAAGLPYEEVPSDG